MTPTPEIDPAPPDSNFARDIHREFGGGAVHLLSSDQQPGLMKEYARVCGKARMPMQPIYVVESSEPNAMAHHSGRLVVTSALLAQDSPQEICGILGHEKRHLHWLQRTMKFALIAIATLLAPALFLADKLLQHRGLLPKDNRLSGWIKAIVLALATPCAFLTGLVTAVRMSEYDSDAAGARFAGSAALIGDLKRHAEEEATAETRHPDTTRGDWLARLLNTHPRHRDRITHLERNPGLPKHI